MKSNRRSFIKKVGLAGAAAIAASHTSFSATDEKDINFISRALRSSENTHLLVA
ncbi:MAG: twin-arginine translocation signal domain-containing protein [Cyclobacteriaceae bacterium]